MMSVATDGRSHAPTHTQVRQAVCGQAVYPQTLEQSVPWIAKP